MAMALTRLAFISVEQEWIESIPETKRLDTSVHRAKGQLAQMAKRQPPSRSKLKESFAVASSYSQVSQEISALMQFEIPPT